MRIPILAGPLRGRWWLMTSPGQLGRFVTATYEPAHAALFERLVKPGMTVLDLGAHVGYFSLLFAQLVGDEGEVWSFEPNRRNYRYLRRHVRINRATNVRIENVAVAEQNGVERFARGSGSGTGHLNVAGPAAVNTIRLDDFCRTRGIRPSFIKIDIEGAEVRALEGARSILESERPLLAISTHGSKVHEETLRLLHDCGYLASPITGTVVRTTRELLARPR